MFSPFAFVIGSSSPLSSNSSHSRTPHTPRHSSPLASLSSSPIEAAKARRRGQYKPGPSRLTLPAELKLSSPEAASRMFLREKFRARCEARLKKAHERAAKRTPWMSSSDGFECDDGYMEDEEEDEEDALNDELFRRVMMRDARRMDHKYNVSYEKEVGSDFDPSYHDPSEIEKGFLEDPEVIPYDPEEELQAYIEEYSNQQDSEGDFEMGHIVSATQFRATPRDGFTTPQRIQRMASSFPFS